MLEVSENLKITSENLKEVMQLAHGILTMTEANLKQTTQGMDNNLKSTQAIHQMADSITKAYHASIATQKPRDAELFRRAATAGRSVSCPSVKLLPTGGPEVPGVTGMDGKSSQKPKITSNYIVTSTPASGPLAFGKDRVPNGDQSSNLFTFKSIRDENNLSQNISQLRKTIEGQTVNKLSIKRDYKLTVKTNIDLWLDSLRSELSVLNLLYIIDQDIEPPEVLDQSILRTRNEQVRDVIINRIDESYHKRIVSTRDPLEIIRKLKEFKRNESNVTSSSVRTRLYALKMHKNEKAVDFIERFENIIREYESCAGAVPLGDVETRSAFYQAISGQFPELRALNLYEKQNYNREMSFEALKTYILQLEAEKKADMPSVTSREAGERPPSAQRARKFEGPFSSIKCFKCEKWGHYSNDCPVAATGRIFCYNCQREADHVAKDCPEPKRERGSGRGGPNQRGGGAGGKYRDKRNKPDNNKGGKRDYPGIDKKGKVTKKPSKRGGKGGKKDNPKPGNSALYTNYPKQISFIADSGATDHIVRNNLILRDFKRAEGGVIKSANKDRRADIKIDGKGDLYLSVKDLENKRIKLTNVLVASDISENLISLRKFAEAGLSIYLDDERLRVFDKDSDETYLEGNYVKPNWVVKLTAETENTNGNEPVFKSYICSANLVGENPALEEVADKFESRDNLENDLEGILFSRKRVDVDAPASLESLENLEELFDFEIEKESLSDKRLSEGMLWHVRLGHASIDYLKKLQKIEKVLENVKFDESILDCNSCIEAKMENIAFKEVRTRATKPLQRIHADTMGPIKPISFPGDKRFILVLLDDYSRLARAYPMKHKSETGIYLKRFLRSTRCLLGEKAQVFEIRSDRGTEFTGGEFADLMVQEGIEADYSPPYTPEHNGTAERHNKTIQHKVRAVMFDSGVPPTMWELGVEAAVYSYNRTPNKAIGFETPLRKFSPGTKSHVDKIKRFGCVAYMKLPSVKTKFSKKAIKTILVGYTPTGYLLWHPNSNRFFESRHVRFNEKLVYKDVFGTSRSAQNESLKQELVFEISPENESELEIESPVKPLLEEPKRKRGRPVKRKCENKNSDELDGVTARKQPKRSAKDQHSVIKSRRVIDNSFALYAKTNVDLSKVVFREIEMGENQHSHEDDEIKFALLASINNDPSSYREAMESREKTEWILAIKDELESMKANNVWEIVNRPTFAEFGKRPNIMDAKWVFKKKRDENSRIKFKARLVIRGFKDINLYELKETYAPVSRLPVVRAVLAIINKFDLDAVQMDVKTAFLNGVIENEIYMEIPDGVECSEHTRRKKVCKLKRSLYGLKISPKKWNERFSKEVRSLELENDLHEPCLFTWRRNGKVVLLLLYVDDLLLAGNDNKKIDDVKRHLSKVFEMKDLGEPKSFLGIEINRDRKQKMLTLSQPDYVEKILERFNLKESRTHDTPMVTRQVKRREGKKSELKTMRNIANVPYREAIGSLLYLSGATRPDIAFAVGYLASKQLEPMEEDWEDVKRVLKYLRGTSVLGLKYQGKREKLDALTDASFRDREDSASTGGYVIRLFGDTIAWRSNKQSYITLSTCQSEYLAMSNTCQEIISLDKAVREITGKTSYPVTLWCDNKAAGECTEKDGSHKLKNFDDPIDVIIRDLEEREKSGVKKHMADTHGDYIKLCVFEGRIKVHWIATKENLADVMTKPLSRDAFIYLRNKLFEGL